MADVWKQNEVKNEEEELVVIDHRDDPAEQTDIAQTEADDEPETVETPTGDARSALEDLGEDVASSPARRGR